MKNNIPESAREFGQFPCRPNGERMHHSQHCLGARNRTSSAWVWSTMGANVLPGALGLLGTDLIGAKGETVKTETLAGKGRVLGLYFSAHWCPPCRGFTPKLAEFYKHFRSGPDGHKLEIVFVSSDKTEAEFRDYCKEMPWLVLPFGDRDRKVKRTLMHILILHDWWFILLRTNFVKQDLALMAHES